MHDIFAKGFDSADAKPQSYIIPKSQTRGALLLAFAGANPRHRCIVANFGVTRNSCASHVVLHLGRDAARWFRCRGLYADMLAASQTGMCAHFQIVICTKVN